MIGRVVSMAGQELSICGTDENQLALNSILGMATKRAWNISRGGKLCAGEKKGV